MFAIGDDDDGGEGGCCVRFGYVDLGVMSLVLQMFFLSGRRFYFYGCARPCIMYSLPREKEKGTPFLCYYPFAFIDPPFIYMSLGRDIIKLKMLDQARLSPTALASSSCLSMEDATPHTHSLTRSTSWQFSPYCAVAATP